VWLALLEAVYVVVTHTLLSDHHLYICFTVKADGISDVEAIYQYRHRVDRLELTTLEDH
jgi:hypothetical protein